MSRQLDAQARAPSRLRSPDSAGERDRGGDAASRLPIFQKRGRSGAAASRPSTSSAGDGGLVARAQRGDAEDIASETWLQITRDLPGFTGNHDQFRGWAATIARHRALDHLRRQARRPPAQPVPAHDLAGLPAGDDTAERALDAVATRAAVSLIATLPPDQAEAVLLRTVLGLDAPAAAAVLGKRPGAIRTAAYRGLRTLARHLEQQAPSGRRPEA